MPTINKEYWATNNFRRKDFYYKFTIDSSVTGWSDIKWSLNITSPVHQLLSLIRKEVQIPFS